MADEKECVVDFYSEFHVINLAAEQTYNNLDVPVTKALQCWSHCFRCVFRCSLHETLETIIHRLVEAEIHLFVGVDEKESVKETVSVSDILQALVLTSRDGNFWAGQPAPGEKPYSLPTPRITE